MQRATSAFDRHACRSCGQTVSRSFVDLGMSPLCENFLSADQLDQPEAFYPLHAYVCEQCWLVQLRQYVAPAEIFGEYAYFSSYSDSWLRHAQEYCRAMIWRFGIGQDSQVVEVASNDGYLLKNFVERGIPALGIEPAANVARAAQAKGVPTRVEFFGEAAAERLVAEGTQADLLVANNVLAHVPDLNDFVAGLARLLSPRGVLTLEFPHLARLIEGNQFDTIYHEHFCYFSLLAAERVLARHALAVFDVDELDTHGGSLRLYVRHADQPQPLVEPAVAALRARERAAGFEQAAAYEGFAERVRRTKRKLLAFLIEAREAGKHIAGYGAPGKGNTLLNYCGIRQDLVDYTVDRNPYKHGKFTPGTHLPIYPPERLAETRPDYILILPWNLREEILAQLAYARRWGARFVLPIPELHVC
jgi:SAM-dependent methyltransferase